MSAADVIANRTPWHVHTGDAVAWLRTVPPGSVRCCVTSPPYYGLRDYAGGNAEIGNETTPKEYVDALVRLFRRVRDALTDDGTLWLNLGDSYEHKELLGIPWQVAFALAADGWWLRADIIWQAPNKMPESVKDRPARQHEYVFLLAKSDKYYYDEAAIREPAVSTGGGASFGKQKHADAARAAGQQSRTYDRPEYTDRTARSVWAIPTKSFHGAHFAVMPEALAARCVTAGSAPGDVILDPFTGSGTTGKVAREARRRFVGAELNPQYAEMARGRIGGVVPGLL